MDSVKRSVNLRGRRAEEGQGDRGSGTGQGDKGVKHGLLQSSRMERRKTKCVCQGGRGVRAKTVP